MTFADRLAGLGFTRYTDYLSSDLWLDFQRRYRESGLPLHCVVCRSPCVQLHHVTYDRLGREHFSDVTPLCGVHHEKVHDWLRKNRLPVGKTPRAILALRYEDTPGPPAARPRKRRRKRKRG